MRPKKSLVADRFGYKRTLACSITGMMLGYLIAAVGVVSAIALWIFGRMAKRWSDMYV